MWERGRCLPLRKIKATLTHCKKVKSGLAMVFRHTVQCTGGFCRAPWVSTIQKDVLAVHGNLITQPPCTPQPPEIPD